MAAPSNYNLQDTGDNGWEFELDFSEWDTQVIVQWIFQLDEDFGDDYEEKFNVQSISGQHFKRNQLGNEQWCRTELGMNQQIEKSFSSIVRQRITKYENHHRKKPYVAQMPKSYVPQIPVEPVVPIIPNQYWECNACTFVNSISSKNCKICSILKSTSDQLSAQIQQLATQKSQIVSLQKELNAIKENNNVLKSQTTSLNEIINCTLNQTNKLREENKQEKEAHKIEIKGLQQQNNVLGSEISLLKKQVNNLKDERKEFEMTINKLKIENKELKLKSIDVSKYKEWNYENILLWIMSLENGRYLKYEQTLRMNLKHEEVIGDNLKDVDAIDIKGWGVANFGDKKSLMQHIQRLVNQMGNVNEGVDVPTAYI
eukprot:45990_1